MLQKKIITLFLLNIIIVLISFMIIIEVSLDEVYMRISYSIILIFIVDKLLVKLTELKKIKCLLEIEEEKNKWIYIKDHLLLSLISFCSMICIIIMCRYFFNQIIGKPIVFVTIIILPFYSMLKLLKAIDIIDRLDMREYI